MAELTTHEIEFLKHHGMAPTQVFDASLCRSTKERESRMSDLDLWFYYGGTRCRRAGHQLRTKAGACMQCDTSKIAFTMRYFSAGYVYLAYSQSNGLAKIGFSKSDPSQRAKTLRRDRYADADDWVVEKFVQLKANAGKTEFAIHSRLQNFGSPVVFERFPGQLVEAREVFACPLETALQAFDEYTRLN